MTRDVPPYLRLVDVARPQLPQAPHDEVDDLDMRAVKDVLRERMALAGLPSPDLAPPVTPGSRAAMVRAAARLILRIEEVDALGNGKGGDAA